ncbi:membrane biogenesis protein [Candidatus Woesearchaeota archaeon]|jgi:uncharacterized protein|nr:membrane biogenesis protein [Candidatus Woesearchaeota archaeon]
MTLNNNFSEIFGDTSIIGMLHLAGERPVQRAMEEAIIYLEEGVDAVIVENYISHNLFHVKKTLEELQKANTGLVVGVNVLPNEYYYAFQYATQYGAQFIQLDHVAGTYDRRGTFQLQDYLQEKQAHPEIVVLGGVWPKYYTPIEGSDLEQDLAEGAERAEAIVVTGEGTGIETDIEKIRNFRRMLGPHKPLIVGAGLNPENAYEQLMIGDGAIVGSCFKPHGNERAPIDRDLVKRFMAEVYRVRQNK